MKFIYATTEIFQRVTKAQQKIACWQSLFQIVRRSKSVLKIVREESSIPLTMVQWRPMLASKTRSWSIIKYRHKKIRLLPMKYRSSSNIIFSSFFFRVSQHEITFRNNHRSTISYNLRFILLIKSKSTTLMYKLSKI